MFVWLQSLCFFHYTRLTFLLQQSNKKWSNFKDRTYTWLQDKTDTNTSRMDSQPEGLWGNHVLPIPWISNVDPPHAASFVSVEKGEEGREVLLKQDESRGREFCIISFNLPGSPLTIVMIMANTVLSTFRHWVHLTVTVGTVLRKKLELQEAR